MQSAKIWPGIPGTAGRCSVSLGHSLPGASGATAADVRKRFDVAWKNIDLALTAPVPGESKFRVAPRRRGSMMARMAALPENFLSSRDFARIARAIRYIDANFRDQPRLSAVAAHVGLSEFHFNRLFRRWAGVTPKQFLSRVTGSAAHLALNIEPSILEAAHAVGLSGPSRLHDLVVSLDAVTPGELKSAGEGVRIRYGFSDTPFGTALFAETPRGLCHLSFVDAGKAEKAEAELRASWHKARFDRDDHRARELARNIWNASGKRSPLQLAAAGTNFQLKVWEALLALGARQHTTYTEVAEAIGAGESVRAVGNAVGANRVGYLIPCHHVLLRSRALGGYRWGEDRKRAMIAWEAFAEPQTVRPANDAAQLQSRSIGR